MRVIAHPTLHGRRQVILDVALRTLEIGLVAAFVFWLLPAIAEAAG